MIKLKSIAILLISLISFLSVYAQQKKLIYVFSIQEEIAPPVVRTTHKAIEEAIQLKADYILIEMNTYGGLVDAADSIRTKILHCPIPVMVHIKNNAASAGALISIACDSIYMSPGSTIGAATVVDQSGNQVPDKYQSYMRKKMRATAEMNNRNPEMAEAMVDPDVVIPGIIDSGKVLTLTTQEAIKHGFCNAEAKNIEEILNIAGIEEYTLHHYTPSFIDNIIGLLIKPLVSGLLIMIIIGGIYFELQTPGIGFPLGAAAIAAVLYFAPLYLEGLAEHWEILIFIVGIILIGVEIFVVPGFGITGISGIFLIILSFTLSMVGNIGFDFPANAGTTIVESLLIVIVSLISSISLSLFLSSKLVDWGLFKKVALATSLEGNVSAETRESNHLQQLIGQKGTVFTPCTPSGKAYFGNMLYDITVINGFAEKGDSVLVTRIEGNFLIVKKQLTQ
jgi:membrane-bound serine protease (ClpP class)